MNGRRTVRRPVASTEDGNTLWALEGYTLTGPAHVVGWSPGPLVLVMKNAGRGAGWFRFGRKISSPGWHVSHYKTRGAAEQGSFGLE